MHGRCRIETLVLIPRLGGVHHAKQKQKLVLEVWRKFITSVTCMGESEQSYQLKLHSDTTATLIH